MLTTIKVDADRKTLPKIAYAESTGGELQFDNIFYDPAKIYHILKLTVRHVLTPNVTPYTRRVGYYAKQIDPRVPNNQFSIQEKQLFTSLSSDFNNSVNKNYNITFGRGLEDNFFSLYDKDTYGITTEIGEISLLGGSWSGVNSSIDYVNYEDEANQMSGMLYYIEEEL
jgi:hypothetical protein